MTTVDAHARLDLLIARAGGDGPQMIGVLHVDHDGHIAVTMDAEDDIDVLMLGATGVRKAGGVTIDAPLAETKPTLEEI